MLNLLASNQIVTYVILGVLVVAIIVMFIFSGRRRKKQEEEAKNLIDAVKPGNKVKTIGGICGIVVEIDNDENTFVLETGTENSGKCFIKFDKQAIYQTDAQVKPTEEKNDEVLPAEDIISEAPAEEKPAETTAEAPAEAPAEEKPAETPAEAKPKKTTAAKKSAKK